MVGLKQYWTPSETRYLHHMRKWAGPDDDTQILTHTAFDRIYYCLTRGETAMNIVSMGESDDRLLLPSFRMLLRS